MSEKKIISMAEKREESCKTLIKIIEGYTTPLVGRDPRMPALSLETNNLLIEVLTFSMHYSLPKAYRISSEAYNLVHGKKITTFKELGDYLKQRLTETYISKK